MDFSLYYFANHDGADAQGGRYDFILESAQWADRNGFLRVWTPERHFHEFGGLSPNPSVLGAALASITRNVQICSGSVVVPLHDPLRIVEEWSMVDNLSGGRVGLGLACGWVPNDFVIGGRQGQFARRKDIFADSINELRRLWRGESCERTNPMGETVSLRTVPRPRQREVPIWITAAGNPDTFRQAGKLGANILTHLLGQSTQGLAEKIQYYREARRLAGHPGQGIVTLMLHTFVGDTDEEVYDLVKAPMKRYLGSSLNLASANLESVPFIKNPGSIDTEALTPDMVDRVLDASFEKYFHMASLMGSYERCLDTVDKLEEIGVDEIACLVDFGVDAETTLAALENLNVVRVLANPKPLGGGRTVSAPLLTTTKRALA